MKLYDISVGLDNYIQSWPDELGFIKKEKRFNSICVSEISMGLHTGTHLDAPYHFLPDGKKISDFPIERFIGKARVCIIEDEHSINVTELKQKKIKNVDRILFKTRNSELWDQDSFNPNFIGLEVDAAKYLINLGITLVGTDYLSIEAYNSPDKAVHTMLLKHEVLILEGLNLSEAPEGDFTLVCCPIKIINAEASPARAFLMETI